MTAGLLEPAMDRHELRAEDADDAAKVPAKMREVLRHVEANQKLPEADRKPQGLIVTGPAIAKMYADTVLRDKFLAASELVDAVIACRVSPSQKAELVGWIKQRHPRKTTLAIGDGANDVSMILKAHVGVGIAGRDGLQAKRAADFALAEFRYLQRLLFKHGREAYRRNSFLILYSFFKNTVYVTALYYFGFYSAFSG